MDKAIYSYSSPLNMGHRLLKDYFDGKVIVQEKIDGSQFSFGLIDDTLWCRSKNMMIDPHQPEKMFVKACETVIHLQEEYGLTPGWIYRGEFLGKEKHNALTYERVPEQYIILYDIDQGGRDYVSTATLRQESWRLYLEFAPILGVLDSQTPTLEELQKYLKRPSILGGRVEGVVLKNYSRYDDHGNLLMAKYVSSEFKESHRAKEFKATKKGTIQQIIEDLRTEARWNKAIYHLRDDGKLEFELKDIPVVIREVIADTFKDHTEDIKERLFKSAHKDIRTGIVKGLAEYYKDWLVENGNKS